MGAGAYVLLLRLYVTTISRNFFPKLSKSLGRRNSEKHYPDVRAPFSYIMGAVLAEVSPSPAWVLTSTPPLLFYISNERFSDRLASLLSTPVRLQRFVPLRFHPLPLAY